MKLEYKSNAEAMAVAKRALYLAWVAAGGPRGMGFLQDRGQQDENAVWDQAYEKRDYNGRPEGEPAGRIDADYVFGRMLKLRFSVNGDSIDFPDHEPRGDYQSWCGRYPSFAALFDEAAKQVAAVAETA